LPRSSGIDFREKNTQPNKEKKTVKEKLRKILADYESRRLWGSIELVFRNGDLTVIQKTESVKETSYDRPNSSSR
jgi:hypothetical protein